MISGVSVPYRPLDETTIASARVIPNLPASATSRRKSGRRRSIALMSRCFFPRKKPYGATRAITAKVIHVRNRVRASCHGVSCSAGSGGRSAKNPVPAGLIRFRTAIRNRMTNAMTPEMTMACVRSFFW